MNFVARSLVKYATFSVLGSDPALERKLSCIARAGARGDGRGSGGGHGRALVRTAWHRLGCRAGGGDGSLGADAPVGYGGGERPPGPLRTRCGKDEGMDHTMMQVCSDK